MHAEGASDGYPSHASLRFTPVYEVEDWSCCKETRQDGGRPSH